MVQGVINRGFGWALALAAAAVAALALTGAAQAITLHEQAPAPNPSIAGDGQVELVWTAIETETGDPYVGADTLQYMWTNTLNESSGWVNIPGNVTLVRSHVISGLQNGIGYTFRVQAIDSEGKRVGPDAVPAGLLLTPSSAAGLMPSDPTNHADSSLDTLVAEAVPAPTAETNFLRLRWGAPADNPSTVTGYEYQWLGPAGSGQEAFLDETDGAWIKVGKATSVTLRSLDNGNYQFRVRSIPSATGETGSLSNIIAFTDAVSTGGAVDLADLNDAATTPEPLQTEASSGSVKLSWTGPLTDVVGETYELQYRTATPEWTRYKKISVSTTGTAVSATVTGLTNGTSYVFRVRAIDNSGAPGTAIRSTADTPGGAVTAPAGLAAVANDGFATLYLDKPADGTVDKAGDTDPVYVEGAYKYQVWLIPDLLLDNLEGDDRWVQRPVGFTVRTGDPTRLQGTVTGLTNGSSYTIRVRAIKDGVGGAYSSVSVTPSATAGTDPDQRPGFTLAATRGSSQVTLEWPAQADTARYEVRDSSQKAVADWTDNSDWRPIPGSNPDTTAYVVTGLTDGTTVSFQVRAMARGAGEDGNLNTADDVFTTEVSRSAVATSPVGIDRTAPDTTFTSTPPIETEATTAEFVISSSEEGSTFECSLDSSPFSACTSPMTLSGLDTGLHVFRARAIDMAGNTDLSSASYTWMVISPPPPPPPDPALAGCTIVGTDGDDILIGTDGDDVICGLGGNDMIRGGAGNDELRGGMGDDTLLGGAGNDVISGGGGNDVIRGGKGDDVLKGRAGNDMIYGERGADMIYGGPGIDSAKVGDRDRARSIENHL